MNKLTMIATVFVAFLLTGCISPDVQEVINSKRDGVFLIINDTTDPATKKQSGGIGTGFLIGDNEILTNAHVVQNGTKLTVKTETSGIYEAEIVKIDSVIDLALIRLKDWEKFSQENKFTVLTLANSRDIKPLDEVYALGNPWGLTFSVTKGVISHAVRRIDTVPKFLIQTDTDIYQGNSGGPLLNVKGEVIGVNSLMLAREGGSYGFAIHSDIVKKVLADWQNGEPQWPVIGVSINDVNVIESLISGSPAEKAGLKQGDKIIALKTSLGKFDVFNSVDITFLIAVSSVSEPIVVTVMRGSEIVNTEIVPLLKTSSDLK